MELVRKGQSSGWDPCLSHATFPVHSEDERGENSRRRRIISSADSFLFISHSWVTTSSVHLPLDLFSSLSPSPLPLSLYPFLSCVAPFLLSLSHSLSRIISCFFMHPNVCNILLSIYRACGMKCVCVCVFVCECASALYLCNSLYLCVYVCGFIGDFLWYFQHCINVGILIHACTKWYIVLYIFFLQTSVYHMELFTKKDTSAKTLCPYMWISESTVWLGYWFINTISFCPWKERQRKSRGGAEVHIIKPLLCGFKVSLWRLRWIQSGLFKTLWDSTPQ